MHMSGGSRQTSLHILCFCSSTLLGSLPAGSVTPQNLSSPKAIINTLFSQACPPLLFPHLSPLFLSSSLTLPINSHFSGSSTSSHFPSSSSSSSIQFSSLPFECFYHIIICLTYATPTHFHLILTSLLLSLISLRQSPVHINTMSTSLLKHSRSTWGERGSDLSRHSQPHTALERGHEGRVQKGMNQIKESVQSPFCSHAQTVAAQCGAFCFASASWSCNSLEFVAHPGQYLQLK